MRLIDADALKEELLKAKEENEKEHLVLIDNDFITLIHDAPTVDAVEVVRCKDCKNGVSVGNDLSCSHFSGLCGLNVVVNNNEFCSYGERANK